MPYLDDERWLHLVHTRAEQPHLALERLRTRQRRPLLTDGKLFIVAADHTARACSACQASRSRWPTGGARSRR